MIKKKPQKICKQERKLGVENHPLASSNVSRVLRSFHPQNMMASCYSIIKTIGLSEIDMPNN